MNHILRHGYTNALKALPSSKYTLNNFTMTKWNNIPQKSFLSNKPSYNITPFNKYLPTTTKRQFSTQPTSSATSTSSTTGTTTTTTTTKNPDVVITPPPSHPPIQPPPGMTYQPTPQQILHDTQPHTTILNSTTTTAPTTNTHTNQFKPISPEHAKKFAENNPLTQSQDPSVKLVGDISNFLIKNEWGLTVFGVLVVIGTTVPLVYDILG